jgi:hypothetical protein
MAKDLKLCSTNVVPKLKVANLPVSYHFKKQKEREKKVLITSLENFKSMQRTANTIPVQLQFPKGGRLHGPNIRYVSVIAEESTCSLLIQH